MTITTHNQAEVCPRGGKNIVSFEQINGASLIVVNLGGGMGGGRHEILTAKYNLAGNLIRATNLITGEDEILGYAALAYIKPMNVYKAVVDDTTNIRHHRPHVKKSIVTSYYAVESSVTLSLSSHDSSVVEAMHVIRDEE